MPTGSYSKSGASKEVGRSVRLRNNDVFFSGDVATIDLLTSTLPDVKGVPDEPTTFWLIPLGVRKAVRGRPVDGDSEADMVGKGPGGTG